MGRGKKRYRDSTEKERGERNDGDSSKEMKNNVKRGKDGDGDGWKEKKT